MSDDLIYEVKGDIGWMTFNRPDQRNALTFAMYDAIAEICRTASDDGRVKAIVMRGSGGRAFAAGTDMTEFRGFSKPDDALAYEKNADSVFTAIEQCSVPTIAAITGACTGGGAAIAASCDIRICDAKLKFGVPIAKTLGNCLSISNLARLSALMGQGRVREMLMTARLILADEAKDIGLVSEVLPDADAVEACAGEIAAMLASHAPLTLRATKEALRRLRVDGPAANDHDLVTMCYMSADFREGMEAFLAKRKPEWTAS
jgi:enoyl-CoA hydratase/carnithine racemase